MPGQGQEVLRENLETCRLRALADVAMVADGTGVGALSCQKMTQMDPQGQLLSLALHNNNF